MIEEKKRVTEKPGQDKQVAAAQTETVETSTQQITCGLIMPIASNDGGTLEHWKQVRHIVESAISSLNLKVQMVSESKAVSVIHKNIVQNIFSNDIVICDVSSRNPNVMFELGMRLAFDKPVVIIKDTETPFSFDINSIQHIVYPHSLNYVEILSFQEVLLETVSKTLEESKRAKLNGGIYSPFLSHFTIQEVNKLKVEDLSVTEYILSSIGDIKDSISAMERKSTANTIITNIKNTLNKSYDVDDELVGTLSEGIIRHIKAENIRVQTFEEIEAICLGYIDGWDRKLPNPVRYKVITDVYEKLSGGDW